MIRRAAAKWDIDLERSAVIGGSADHVHSGWQRVRVLFFADFPGHFGARGLPWAAVARALSPEQGMASRAAPRQAAWARLPAFTVV